MGCEALKDLMPLHVLGLLGAEEEAPLRRHLDGGCPRCASELAATRQAIDALPYALPAEEPSTFAKERLFATIRKERAAAPRPRSIARATAAAFAASVAAAVTAALMTGWTVGRRAEEALAGLRGQIERQSEEMTSLRRQIQAAQDSLRLISAPGVLVADLAGQGERSESTARVFWDKQRDRWELYAANLPPAAPGKTYQLWLVTATAKVSAGTFDPGGGATATGSVQVPTEAGQVVAAAITEEPAGGSPQPTGSILLLGKI